MAKPKSEAAKRAAAAAKRREAQARRERDRQQAEMALAKDGLTGAAKTVENAKLYKLIFSDWLRGLSYDALAAKHKLGVRRCKQIVGELRDAQLDVLALDDPLFGLREAHDLVLHLKAAVSEYAQLATARGAQTSVRLGALRERDRAVMALKDTLQELGVLPKHLGTLRVQEDYLALVDAMLDEMERQGLPVNVQRAIVEAAEAGARGEARGLPAAEQEGAVDGSAEEVAA